MSYKVTTARHLGICSFKLLFYFHFKFIMLHRQKQSGISHMMKKKLFGYMEDYPFIFNTFLALEVIIISFSSIFLLQICMCGERKREGR